MKTKEQRKAERLARAQEIADFVKAGGRPPVNGDAFQSAWPARGKIKKDKEAIKQIYGEDSNERDVDPKP